MDICFFSYCKKCSCAKNSMIFSIKMEKLQGNRKRFEFGTSIAQLYLEGVNKFLLMNCWCHMNLRNWTSHKNQTDFFQDLLIIPIQKNKQKTTNV